MDVFRNFIAKFKAPPTGAGGVGGVIDSRPRLSEAQIEDGRQEPIGPPSEQLEMFRLLTGITSHNTLTTTRRRPAPNLGIYRRVCRAEQHSKKSFKTFSILINGCLGLQIIVAAALTAMGAANSNHKAITVFGAINTVIAGFLTFLKGSGLPGRLKYYHTEWKKLREYVEQRERDFSQEHCTLNVFQVVETIERMYEDTERDIEANTPDGYASHSLSKARAETSSVPSRYSTLTLPTRNARGTENLKDLDGESFNKIEKFSTGIDERAKSVEAGVHARTKEAEKIREEIEGLARHE